MNDVKREMIFGDQSLFDGAPEDAEAVGGGKPHQDALVFYKFSDGEFQYKYEAEIDDWKVSTCKHPQSVIKAMRRIIKTPAWTVTDQKAGRLPAIGDEHLFDGLTGKFICRFIDFDGDIWSSGDDGQMYSSGDYEAIPLETPAEKAQRLREEWKNNVIEIHHGKRRKMSTSTFLLDDIYDALLSGELQVPKAGE